MANVHTRVAQWIDPATCQIGLPPVSVSVGRGFQSVYNNLINWQALGQLYTYHGSRDTTVNPYSGTHYIITHAPDLYDETHRRVAVVVVPWFMEQQGAPADDITVEWYDAITGGSAQTLLEMAGNTVILPPSDPSAIAGESANVITRDVDEDEIIYTAPTADPYFGVARIEYNHIQLHHVGVHHIPFETIDDSAYRHPIGQYVEGALMRRGYLGNLFGDIGGERDDDNYRYNERSIERNTRRCLFQFGHPSGIVVGDGPIIDGPGDALVSFKLKPRDLLGGTYALAVPAFIVSHAHEGDTVTFGVWHNVDVPSGAADDTWTWTCPVGGIASATLITPDDGVASFWGYTVRARCDGTSVCQVSVNAEEANPVTLNTVSLWEIGPW